jgi:hypothetical protein
VRFKRLATGAGKTMPFAEAEVARMLQDVVAARSPQLRAIVLTFLFIGLRISDVVRFPVESLDLKNGRSPREVVERQRIRAILAMEVSR